MNTDINTLGMHICTCKYGIFVYRGTHAWPAKDPWILDGHCVPVLLKMIPKQSSTWSSHQLLSFLNIYPLFIDMGIPDFHSFCSAVVNLALLRVPSFLYRVAQMSIRTLCRSRINYGPEITISDYRPRNLCLVSDMEFIFNLVFRRSFQLSAWSEGVPQLLDWLLSSGGKGTWSDALSVSNPRVLCIFCRTDFRRLITLMTSFISCHDSRLWKSSTLGRDKKEYV